MLKVPYHVSEHFQALVFTQECTLWDVYVLDIKMIDSGLIWSFISCDDNFMK